MTSSPAVDVTIDEQGLEEGVFNILLHIRPKWIKETTTLKRHTQGLINKMVSCHSPENPSEDVMVRVFNSVLNDKLDRKKEVSLMEELSKRDACAKVVCTFNNGFCYEFIHGVNPHPSLLATEPVWRLVACEVAKLHADVDDKGEHEPHSEAILKVAIQSFPNELPNAAKNIRFQAELLPYKEYLLSEVEKLKQHMKPFESPIVLCHNDIQCGNMVYNQEKGVLKLIDFEWSTYSRQAGDIALHFVNFGGPQPPDFTSYPHDKEFQKKWLREYLEKWFFYRVLNDEVTEKQVETLYVQVQKYFLYMCATAGLIAPMFELSGILDIDMISYGIQGMKEYNKWKDEIVALESP